jgi:predicted ArsR family transcriptional regulator
MGDGRTRALILQALAERPASSAAELAQALGLTPAGVRYHLADLLAHGQVETCPPRGPDATRRGRPAQAYRRPALEQANNYRQLADALLRCADGVGAKPFAEALAAALAQGFVPPHSGSRRLTDATQWFNQQGYQASWEAHQSGPRVTFHNCPYAALRPTHPELCTVDARLVAQLIGAPVETLALIQPGQTPHAVCLFQARAVRTASRP